MQPYDSAPLARQVSMQGRASDVLQMRRQRRLSEMQMSLLKFIVPINVIAVLAVLFCAIVTFTADRYAAIEKSKSIFYAATFLQSYWVYIVCRDLLITINFFIRGQGLGRDVVLAVLVVHFFSSCIDNLALSGLTIWSTVAIHSDEAKLFTEADQSTGLPTFMKVMTFNATMGYIYVLSHILAPCVIGCIMVRY